MFDATLPRVFCRFVRNAIAVGVLLLFAPALLVNVSMIGRSDAAGGSAFDRCVYYYVYVCKYIYICVCIYVYVYIYNTCIYLSI